MGSVRILSGIAQATALPQQIPTLVQLNFNSFQSRPLGRGQRSMCSSPIQPMLFRNQLLHMVENALIFSLFAHEMPHRALSLHPLWLDVVQMTSGFMPPGKTIANSFMRLCAFAYNSNHTLGNGLTLSGRRLPRGLGASTK
jgi:hypothetical protein